jgi:alanyl-tRNA synthetase
MQGLKTIADNLVNTLKNSVIVLAGVKEDKGFFVVKIAAQTMKNHSLTANDLIKQLTNITGGNGGGRPDMAQAGGIEIAKIDQALQSLHDFLATA